MPEGSNGERAGALRRTTIVVAVLTGVLLGAAVVGATLRRPSWSTTVGADAETVVESDDTGALPVATGPAGTGTVPAFITTTTATGSAATPTSPTGLDTSTMLPPTPRCPAGQVDVRPIGTLAAPAQDCLSAGATYRAEIVTSEGTITVALDPSSAPANVNNFIYLARNRFYDGLVFHRILKDYIAQTGDPDGDGNGGPGYSVVDELPATPGYPVGAVAMANGNPGKPSSNGSQFFIVTGPLAAEIAPMYPRIGTVVNGMNVVAKINAYGSETNDGRPSGTVAVEQITIVETSDRTAPPPAPSTTPPPTPITEPATSTTTP